jgi:peptidylglycine monooxygenase
MTETLVALGRRLYRVDRGWAANGPTSPLTALTAIAFGLDGLLHVLRRERPFLLSLNADGTVAGQADALDVQDGHGLFAAGDRSLWIAARDGHMVLQVTPSGEVLSMIGNPVQPAPFGPFGHPTRCVVAPDGELYVSDGYADAVIRRFDRDRSEIGSWGTPGVGPGQFKTPHSLWVSGDRVVVADRDNDRLQVFDRAGALLDVWPDFVRPMDLFGDDGGRLFVSEDAPRLSMLDDSGALIGRCRLPSLLCHGIAGDPGGNLFIAEVRMSLITRLTLLEVD